MSGPSNKNPEGCPPATTCGCGSSSNNYYFQETACSFAPWNCQLMEWVPFPNSYWDFIGGAYSIHMTCNMGLYTVTLGYGGPICGDGQGAGGASFSFRPAEGQCKFIWKGKMSPAVRATCNQCGGETLQGQVRHSSFGCP